MLVVTTEGLTYEDHCRMAEYESCYFSQDLIVPPEITYRWQQVNEYTMIAVRDSASRKIVGHVSPLPIKEEFYERYRSGEFTDQEMTIGFLKPDPDIVRAYDQPGLYMLYLCSIAIHPDYSRRTNALRVLFNGSTQIFLKLALKGIYISHVFGVPVTREGARLCNKLGLTPDQAFNSTCIRARLQ